MMPTTIAYPETKRGDVVEEHFGQAISDPYHWLENDVRNDQEVARLHSFLFSNPSQQPQ
ncbi:hypothetical protein NDI45_30025 [Leptolyngbya sp. GB1-A1]